MSTGLHRHTSEDLEHLSFQQLQHAGWQAKTTLMFMLLLKI